MGKLSELQKRLEKFDPNEILNEVLKDTKKPEELVKERLNEEGKDSKGRKLRTYGAKGFGKGVYTPYTTMLKKQKGQPFDRVTLKDTGAFQKSFEKILLKEAFNIEGNSKKDNGEIEDNVDLTNVLNLSKNELSELVNEIKPDYIEAVRQSIGL